MKKKFSLLALALASCVTALAGSPLTSQAAEIPQLGPSRIWGTMTKSGNDTIIFDNQSGESYQGDIVIHISEDTKILDAQNGFPVSPDSIQDGQTAYAYIGPAMTMSIPPQTNSPMILTEIPADYKVPDYVTVKSMEDKGAAYLLTAADGSVIPADGLLEILSVDENGHAICKTDLPFGSFYFKEISTDSHYILSDEKYPFEFSYAGQETALVEIRANDGKPIDNDLIYGEIHGLKKDEEGNALGGAVIGLFKADCTEFTRENAILTATSAGDGGFSFADVPYGNWLVRELESPTGFVLSEETFSVTVDKDGAVIEVEIENTLIRGNVQLTKVDRDSPANKLSGAEFSVYRDSNGDKTFDADDEPLGTLTENSAGVYEMPDLIYGGYFVKETKAPEGFYLDENAYYFEITEHGKTVIVENEASKGFVNAPQVGSLKIVKTSSDGKVEGFAFRITGANGYSEVFTTDKNGEILIENLRIGEYVVSEVSDGVSAAYVLPADKTASVFEGAVTVVKMHNELRDTPNFPRTSV